MTVSSIAPSSMRCATTADSSRSARNFGKIRPFDTAPSSPDALQAARHRLRRLDLQHQVDGAHVDAELERRRRDEARDLPRLQQLLDLDPLLARERAVVGARDLRLRQLVQAKRKPFGQPAVVDEQDRRAVLLHEPKQLRIDRRPNRRLLRFPHVLERHHDLQVELLRGAGVDQLDLTCARDEPADLLHGPLRRRQPDPLERLLDEPLEALHRKREVRAALGARDRVHLVEDQRADALQVLARARGEHEIERLRSRDQNVRRVPQHLRPLLLRRVARADSDAEARLQSCERAAQVPLDVVVERLQRRDVEQPQALAGLRDQPVDPVQERRERLARAGRGLDERVLAARDRRPAEPLRRSRLAERVLEPRPRRR
jgi:hypothetical protein